LPPLRGSLIRRAVLYPPVVIDERPSEHRHHEQQKPATSHRFPAVLSAPVPVSLSRTAHRDFPAAESPTSLTARSAGRHGREP
jgi:hypothetical protein